MRKEAGGMARMKVAKNIAYDDQRKKYYVTFHYGNGEKRTKTFDNKKDATRALKQFESDKANDDVVKPAQDSLGEWMLYWMENICKPRVRETTFYGYRNIIENHLVPGLGNIKLQKLTASDIRNYQNEKLSGEKRLSPNTVRKHHELLNMILGDAVLEEKLRKNPLQIVTNAKKVPVEHSIYSVEELQQLFKMIKGNRLEIAVKLAGYYGLRREEICGLKWDAIDFEKGIFTIRQAMTMAGSRVLIDETKTERSYRKEALNDDVRDLLLSLKKRQDENRKLLKDEYMDAGYILCWPDGKPYRPNYVSELFTKFLKENGMKKIVLHELRHTFASIANEMGIPIYNISRVLGHSSVAITSGIYTHLFDETHKKTIDRVTEAIMKSEAKDKPQ